MPEYTVGAGESIASIAKENGYLWKTLWDHGNNAGLRKQRANPNQLVEGDVVFLPDKSDRMVSKATDGSHRFKRKGEPTSLKIRLTSGGEPRRNEPYTLTFDGQVIHGTTDGDGRLEQPIPGEVKSATLLLSQGREAYPLAVGLLDPVSMTRGVRQRLANLGYDCGGEEGDALGDATRAALARFQSDHGIQATGDIDGATRAKLDELHV